MIAIAAYGQIPGNLFIRTATKNKARIISIDKMKQSLIRYDLQNIDIQLLLKSLISLHALTGCDTSGSFSGRGKVKTFKVMLKNQSHIEEFSAFGHVPTVSDQQLEWIQAFVCDVYGHKGKDVNLLRYKLYSSRQGKLEAHSIPPCLDSFHLHSRRAACQTFVWRNCLIAKPDIPSPIGNGWELGENESISIKWNTLNPAPDKVLELMFCTCSRNCVQGKMFLC